MATAWENIETKGLKNLETVKNDLDKVKELRLTLVRRWFTSNSSIGKLRINGLLYCYTLEDVTRENEEKVKKETAIPYGIYEILMTVSGIAYKWNTPGSLLPLIAEVPGFTGIRIHPGVRKEHTEGCVLAGFTRTTDQIGNSAAAFWPLFSLLMYAHQKGYPIKIQITNYERRVLMWIGIALGITGVFFLIRYLIKFFKP